AVHRGSARDDTPPRKTKRRRDVAVAAERYHAIDQESGAHRQLATRDRSFYRQRKDERLDGVWRNAPERAALAHRFAGAPQIEGLQISQAAVDRAQVIER